MAHTLPPRRMPVWTTAHSKNMFLPKVKCAKSLSPACLAPPLNGMIFSSTAWWQALCSTSSTFLPHGHHSGVQHLCHRLSCAALWGLSFRALRRQTGAQAHAHSHHAHHGHCHRGHWPCADLRLHRHCRAHHPANATPVSGPWAWRGMGRCCAHDL